MSIIKSDELLYKELKYICLWLGMMCRDDLSLELGLIVPNIFVDLSITRPEIWVSIVKKKTDLRFVSRVW